MPTLKPARFAEDVTTCISNNDAKTLATYLSHRDEHGKWLLDSTPNPVALPLTIRRYLESMVPSWAAIFEAHCRVVIAMRDTEREPCPDFIAAFEAQKNLVTAYNDLIRVDLAPWTLPVMYTINRELRELSMEADATIIASGGKGGKQEEMIRVVQVGFGACCNDRSTPVSRKVGVMYMATLLFKTYFRLNSLALCKNVIRGVDNAGLPTNLGVPRSHRITFNYYLGALAFLQEDYDKAEKHLEIAGGLCNRASIRNLELILDYLIPLKLYRGKRLCSRLLSHFSRLNEIYRPLGDAIAYGDIQEFDRLLQWAEPRLLGRRTYLLVERCRDVCLTNTLRLIHHIENQEAKLSFQVLKVIASYPGESIDAATTEDVECVLANLISQDRVKGYLSHGNATLVLSKTKPFNPPYTFAGSDSNASPRTMTPS